MSILKGCLKFYPNVERILFFTSTVRFPEVLAIKAQSCRQLFKSTATSNLLFSTNNESEPILHITKACSEQLKKVAVSGEFLRVSVEGGGCSGFSYKLSLDKDMQDDDIAFERDGVKVVSDQGSLDLIKGSTVDYEVELIKSAFSIKSNPQSTMKCSCGVSFSIE